MHMVKRIPDEEYFAAEGVSHSKLTRLAKCPAAMNYKLEETPAMILGSLTHCLILEGKQEFEKRYAVTPECDRRTKAGKEEYQAFRDENPNKILVSVDDVRAAAGMADSVFSHPSVKSSLSAGEPEVAIFWEEEGLQCKGKADWIAFDCLVDLKTTNNASDDFIQKNIMNGSYFRQAAFYRSGLRGNSLHVDKCLIIAVENKPPFFCGVYSLSEELLTYGEGQYKELLRKYKSVKDLEVLPTYNNAGIVEIYPPAWLAKSM